MQENGFHMPKWKGKYTSDVVNTGPYMKRVRDLDYWVPKVENVNFKPVSYPPTKTIIWAELQRLLNEQHHDLGLRRPTSLDVEWLLQLVGTLDP